MGIRGKAKVTCKGYLLIAIDVVPNQTNILYHDVINTKVINDEEIIKETLNNISVEQIIPLSKYSVLIDDSINPKTKIHEWDYIYNDYLRRYK